MENVNTLKMVRDSGWRMGFANLFDQVNAGWWRTKTWLVQAVVWLLILNGMLALVIWNKPSEQASAQRTQISAMRAKDGNPTKMDLLTENQAGNALFIFMLFSGLALPIGAIIAGQDALIGERQSGTAAWVLSKPVSRAAFILSKLSADGIGLLVTGVIIQGMVAYAQIAAFSKTPLYVPGYLGAMGLIFLNMMFYLTLTFMLGSIFRGRGPVLGITLALALGSSNLTQNIPALGTFTPWSFFLPDTSGNLPPAVALALGQPLTSIIPVVSSVALCVIFTAIAILRFQREEF